MNKHLKLFANHTAYEAAKNNIDKPNVVMCQQEDEVHFNPLQPIAPVGKVQVFANPQCTEYADGQSNEVWVRLNQDFEFDEYEEWGNGSNPRAYLKVHTPVTGAPTDPYAINLWVDFTEVNRDGSQPFEEGEVVECSMPPQYFVPITNPQVIFE